MRGRLALILVLVFLAGCRAGTASPELEQLRARVSVLEAENAHLLGQQSLMEAERDQLRDQVTGLMTELAEVRGRGAEVTVSGRHLVVLPREIRPGEWLAVHVTNYPERLLPQAGVALRLGEANLAHVRQLTGANLFLLPVPRNLSPGGYQIVLGEAGTFGPGTKIDDRVTVEVRPR